MKFIVTGILMLIVFNVTYGQSFEGKLTYKVDFTIDEKKLEKMGISKDMWVSKMKEEGKFYDEIVFYIKSGNYIKAKNSISKVRLIYKAEENQIYLFEENSQFVTKINADNPNSINWQIDRYLPTISKSDSIKVIKRDSCKLVIFNWEDLSKEYYWYNSSKLNIKPDLFKNHNYEYLNKVLQITNAFPLEISKSISDFVVVTMTIDKIEETQLNDSLFNIPKLKNSNRKRDKFIERITGNKIMRIKGKR